MSKQSAAHDRSEKAALHAAEEKAEAAAQEAAAQEVATQEAGQAEREDDRGSKLKVAREVLLRHLGNAALVDALEDFVRAIK